MGDALTCLSCGRSKYPEVFGSYGKIVPRPVAKTVLHFVGFTGDEWISAVRVWGVPDFVHRWADDRFWLGGERAPGDVVVYANGEETRLRRFILNDSDNF